MSLSIIKGREDDNIETIRKRFKVFLESSLPVINYYDAKGKVRKVIDSCAFTMFLVSFLIASCTEGHSIISVLD